MNDAPTRTGAIDRMEAEEDAEEAGAAELEAEPLAKPKPIDWVAGIVAVVLQLGAYLFDMGVLIATVWWLRKVW